MRKLAAGEVGIPHYQVYLRETYYYTREDPQIQAFATAWFRGQDRKMVKPFLRHALSEVGHEQLALNDLAVLGEDTSQLPHRNPLPSTIAMTSFAYYAIQFRKPISYLGWLWFLEFLPTSGGEKIASMLAALGVPESAMTFLNEHRDVDVGHNELMATYVAQMVTTKDDLEEVAYAMEVTGALFANMVDGAFESVGAGQPSPASALASMG
jgi:pyrroloquinoline quinone (PQQ) biosynthesis protein C